MYIYIYIYVLIFRWEASGRNWLTGLFGFFFVHSHLASGQLLCTGAALSPLFHLSIWSTFWSSFPPIWPVFHQSDQFSTNLTSFPQIWSVFQVNWSDYLQIWPVFQVNWSDYLQIWPVFQVNWSDYLQIWPQIWPVFHKSDQLSTNDSFWIVWLTVDDSFWIEIVIEIVIVFVMQTFDQVNITIASTWQIDPH